MSELPKISELLKHPEQMRVMCAEACGFQWFLLARSKTHLLIHKKEAWTNAPRWNLTKTTRPEDWIEEIDAAPKYDTSLDAMALAEATLTDDEHVIFRHALLTQCIKEANGGFGKTRLYHSRTALHRIMAFLEAKGLAQP